MAVEVDPNFSFNQQLWYYYTTNRGKIRSRYNDLTRKFLAYNDSDEAAVRGSGDVYLREGIHEQQASL